MSSTKDDNQNPPLGRGPFVVGGLAFVPLFGVVFGCIAIVWGLVTKRPGGKKLAAVGLAGIICLSVIPYGALFYFGFVQRGGMYDGLRLKQAQNSLNTTVQSIEFYKVANGNYPDSMDILKSSLPEKSLQATSLYDPRVMGEQSAFSADKSAARYFYYRKVGEDHYYLRGVAPDGNPFSPGALVPQVNLSSASKVGLLTSPPSPATPSQ